MARIWDSRKLKSYFWLYAPVSDIQLAGGRYIESVTGSHPDFNQEMTRKIPNDEWHITFVEQNKPRKDNPIFPKQPIKSNRQIQDIIQTIRSEFLGNDGPLVMQGKGLDIVLSARQIHLTLAFNKHSQAGFTNFHNAIVRSLGHRGFIDFRKEGRSPHILLASVSTRAAWLQAADPYEYKRRLQERFSTMTTKPITLDHLVLGQSFYSREGYCVRQSDRIIAKIYCNGEVKNLCPDPFNNNDADTHINRDELRARAKRQTRRQGIKAPSYA